MTAQKPNQAESQHFRHARESLTLSSSQAVIACGSNLENPQAQLKLAQNKVAQIAGVKLLAASPFYVTKPVGMLDQPDFLNGAFLVETTLTSRELLEQLLKIEKEQGRVRQTVPGTKGTGSRTCPLGTRYLSRTLDLDLIFFGGEIRKEEGLELPHPRAQNREFVLKPVADLVPDWIHPVLGKTVKELLLALSLRAKRSNPNNGIAKPVLSTRLPRPFGARNDGVKK